MLCVAFGVTIGVSEDEPLIESVVAMGHVGKREFRSRRTVGGTHREMEHSLFAVLAGKRTDKLYRARLPRTHRAE